MREYLETILEKFLEISNSRQRMTAIDSQITLKIFIVTNENEILQSKFQF